MPADLLRKQSIRIQLIHVLASVLGTINLVMDQETVQARFKRDRKYRKALLREGVEFLLAGDLDTGKAILRDYT